MYYEMRFVFIMIFMVIFYMIFGVRYTECSVIVGSVIVKSYCMYTNLSGRNFS